MEQETGITKTAPTEIERLDTPDGDVVVLARNPEEMATAQQGLLDWAERKVAFETKELADVQENLDIAKKMKHRTAGWTSQLTVHRNRVKYYEKVLAALQAGLCIVPNFPVQIIAVRTKKKAPNKKKYTTWQTPSIKHEQLPTGDGEYVDPTPHFYEGNDKFPGNDGRTETRHFVKTTGRHIEVDFPFKTAKPQVMQDFSRAAALKIFDEIGVLPQAAQQRTADPMLIGRIRRRNAGSSETMISFLITWWVDTRTL